MREGAHSSCIETLLQNQLTRTGYHYKLKTMDKLGQEQTGHAVDLQQHQLCRHWDVSMMSSKSCSVHMASGKWHA